MIFVCGCNDCNQLGEQSNNKYPYSHPFIWPYKKSRIDPSTLLSYSFYSQHSVIITNDHKLYGIGENSDGIISGSLKRAKINEFTQFSIEDDQGHQLIPISAVCSSLCTLYMVSQKDIEKDRQLYISYSKINSNQPLFVNIGDRHPVALFGGCFHTAAIDDQGDVIFIHNKSYEVDLSTKIFPSSPIPNGEKAISVAILYKTVFVLSSSGKVYESNANDDNNLTFSDVKELDGIEISCISGTNEHVVAVSKDYRVFIRGSCGSGRLGLGTFVQKFVQKFTEIQELRKCNIVGAYAGAMHSLFRSSNGKIFACGYNGYGELFSDIDNVKSAYSPIETIISKDATFCIAGGLSSLVFICVEPPPNIPNN